MKNVASMPRDNEKRIEIHGGAGEKGIKVFKVALWKSKCQSYFNRYFKTSSIIVLPSDEDIIMNTLQSVCSENKSRGFVFKNYDILKHLKFLGYDRKLLEANLEHHRQAKVFHILHMLNKGIQYLFVRRF